jgi:hypothetical protein
MSSITTATTLADALKVNRASTKIDLRGYHLAERLSDEDAVALARALKLNT